MKRKRRFLIFWILALYAITSSSSCAYASTNNKELNTTTLLTAFDKSVSEWYSDPELFVACAIGDCTGTFNDDELTTIAEAMTLDTFYVAKMDSSTLLMLAFGKDKIITLGFSTFSEKAYYTTTDQEDASSVSSLFMSLLKEKGTFSTYKKADAETVGNNIDFLTNFLTSIVD